MCKPKHVEKIRFAAASRDSGRIFELGAWTFVEINALAAKSFGSLFCMFSVFVYKHLLIILCKTTYELTRSQKRGVPP